MHMHVDIVLLRPTRQYRVGAYVKTHSTRLVHSDLPPITRQMGSTNDLIPEL